MTIPNEREALELAKKIFHAKSLSLDTAMVWCHDALDLATADRDKVIAELRAEVERLKHDYVEDTLDLERERDEARERQVPQWMGDITPTLAKHGDRLSISCDSYEDTERLFSWLAAQLGRNT